MRSVTDASEWSNSCIGGVFLFYFFCVTAFFAFGSLSLSSDACQRRKLES